MKKYRVWSIIFLLVSILIVCGVFVFYRQFPDTTFEQIVYHLRTSLGGTAKDIIFKFSKEIIAVILGTILLIVGFILFNKYYLSKRKKKDIDLKKALRNSRILFYSSLVIFIGAMVYLVNSLGIVEYFESYKHESLFIKENYVFPSDEILEFPKKKNNLILVYLESIESSMSNKKNGGVFDNNYIPNLTKLAKENTSFSSNDKLGGATQIWGTNWSTAGYLATSGGILIKTPLVDDQPNSNPARYPKLIALGDILKDDYNESLMLGADAGFGGVKEYFETHDNFKIWDDNNADAEGLINDNTKNSWGLNDKGIMERSKEELLSLAKEDKPFLFTLITVDTHAEDGYIDPSCEKKYATSYENSVACEDKMINDYVNWLKEQDFYKDTTIVLIGDHLSMNHSLFNNVDKNQRFVYNVIINSMVEKKYNHVYTPIDYFPTILSSMGIKIKGNKLGLGVNLFSEEKTLIEEYGLDYINNEFSKKSSFYENELLY